MRRARLLQALLLGLAVGGLGLLLGLSPGWRLLEEGIGQSWLFTLRGPLPPPDQVRVVALDRISAERLGLPVKLREWPREIHGRLIDRLAGAGASVITLDLIFDRPRSERAEDRALARAIEGAGNVILLEMLDRANRAVEIGDGAAGIATTLRVIRPIPELAGPAAALAPFPLPRVPARLNHFWTFTPAARMIPTVPAVALEQHLADSRDTFARLLDERVPSAGDWNGALTSAMGDFRLRLDGRPEVETALRNRVATLGLDPAARRALEVRLNLYGGPDARWINFYGPPGQVRTFSAHTVLDERGFAEVSHEVEGRAVFIGLAEQLDPHADDFETVYSRADGVDLAGVEIAATAFANLLDGRTLSPVRGWSLAALLLCFGLVVGGSAALLPALLAVPATFALALAYGWLAVLAFHEALWPPLAIPLLVQLPLGLFGGLLLQYRAARRAEQNLASGIAYYLPPAIAGGLAEEPLSTASRAELVDGVCLVSDVEHFTRRAEYRSPDEVSVLLNRYFEIAFKAISAEGGLVTDIVGDGITAFWRGTSPEVRLAACRAALAMGRSTARMEIGPGERGLPTRIGLNCGRVMLGGVGGSGRFAYSVVGDAVNTAARIEQLNKHLGTRLVASTAVTEGLPGLELRPLGDFVLYGKQGKLALVELLDVAEEPAPDWLRAFVAALEAFRAARFEEAEAGFAGILAGRKDGPSRFYLGLCRREGGGLAEAGAGGAVTLHEK
ncbi:MAG TPA: adenylate/guanylate cyclase domain-containing protein [Geminicoccaceae bacterium]